MSEPWAVIIVGNATTCDISVDPYLFLASFDHVYELGLNGHSDQNYIVYCIGSSSVRIGFTGCVRELPINFTRLILEGGHICPECQLDWACKSAKYISPSEKSLSMVPFEYMDKCTLFSNRYEKGMSLAKIKQISFGVCSVIPDNIGDYNFYHVFVVLSANIPQIKTKILTVVHPLPGANWGEALTNEYIEHADITIKTDDLVLPDNFRNMKSYRIIHNGTMIFSPALDDTCRQNSGLPPRSPWELRVNINYDIHDSHDVDPKRFIESITDIYELSICCEIADRVVEYIPATSQLLVSIPDHKSVKDMADLLANVNFVMLSSAVCLECYESLVPLFSRAKYIDVPSFLDIPQVYPSVPHSYQRWGEGVAGNVEFEKDDVIPDNIGDYYFDFVSVYGGKDYLKLAKINTKVLTIRCACQEFADNWFKMLVDSQVLYLDVEGALNFADPPADLIFDSILAYRFANTTGRARFSSVDEACRMNNNKYRLKRMKPAANSD